MTPIVKGDSGDGVTVGTGDSGDVPFLSHFLGFIPTALDVKGTVLLTPLDTYNYSPILNAFDDFYSLR